MGEGKDTPVPVSVSDIGKGFCHLGDLLLCPADRENGIGCGKQGDAG